MNHLPCPVCSAEIDEHFAEQHLGWHFVSDTLGHDWTLPKALDAFRARVQERRQAAWLANDDAPTAKLPPITDTVRRRPPPPVVRELSERVELLRALVQELADYDETDQ